MIERGVCDSTKRKKCTFVVAWRDAKESVTKRRVWRLGTRKIGVLSQDYSGLTLWRNVVTNKAKQLYSGDWSSYHSEASLHDMNYCVDAAGTRLPPYSEYKPYWFEVIPYCHRGFNCYGCNYNQVFQFVKQLYKIICCGQVQVWRWRWVNALVNRPAMWPR